MPAEIFAAVSACSTAYRFMKKAVSEGKELQDMTRAIGAFWDAREEISVIEQQATNPSKIAKLFGGSSVEAQALEVTLQKNKALQLEKDLKDLFFWSGNAHLWNEMVRERAKIRNLRIAAAKQKAQTRAAMIDLSMVVLTLGVCAMIILGAASIIT